MTIIMILGLLILILSTGYLMYYYLKFINTKDEGLRKYYKGNIIQGIIGIIIGITIIINILNGNK